MTLVALDTQVTPCTTGWQSGDAVESVADV